jgi:hypothetical protein
MGGPPFVLFDPELPPEFELEFEFDLTPAPGINTGGALGVKTAGLGMHDVAAPNAPFTFASALMVAFPENEHAVGVRWLSSKYWLNTYDSLIAIVVKSK